MIGETVTHYLITRKLGAGGMGEVFLAKDQRLDRLAAIKFLPKEQAEDAGSRRRFLTEAKAASALNHPNVCVVYEVGETSQGIPFIAMEYIPGESLEEVLRRERMEISRAVEIALQVADVLDAAHALGVIHRDLKPANIGTDARGQIKVLDFGLAKRLLVEGAAPEAEQTRIGMVMGTPCYMSPEQTLGKETDHRTDIFSLGVILYRLTTGLLPFKGSSYHEVFDHILHSQPTAIARLNYDVPPELERITIKCLQKSPDRRYQSARELMIDLKSLAHELEHGVARTKAAGDRGESTQLDFSRTRSAVGFKPETVPQAPINGSDVVITYAGLDNQPVLAGRKGWISQLHENLQVRLAQLSGKKVAVIQQPDVSDSAEMEAEVLNQVPTAKTVISILSPPFVRSAGCHRIVQAFWNGVRKSNQPGNGERSRLLKVIKSPVDEQELPLELRAVYTGLAPYEFFERDQATGRLREFDEAFGDTAVQRFHERVYDIAYDVSQVLKHLGDDRKASPQRTEHPKTIFLAATTSDLEPQRDQLRRELTELGHDVLPKQPLPLVASELITVVEGCLEQADIAIHFIGEYFGLVPEATDLSVVALQNQVAARFCGNSSLKRLIWIPKGLRPRDDRQSAFIRQLESEPSSVTGAELIADTLENLKVLLRTRWEREIADGLRQAKTAPVGDAPRVYLICDKEDEAAIEPLEDFFYAQGIEVSLPGFEAEESEVQQIHIQNLRDCDAALIYYGAVGMHWVDFKIRDLQKAAGYRDSAPIQIRAVYLAPPTNHRKERFKSVSVQTIQQPRDTFDPAVLMEFVRSLRSAKGGKS